LTKTHFSIIKVAGLTSADVEFYTDDEEGISASYIHSRLRGECSYQAELDAHFPTLTVGETIILPVEARKPPPSNSDLSARSDARSAAANILHSLGLSQVLDTKVGNDTIPGISGGERKRLSIAEVLACSTSLQCWDNSTRGLDSANSLQFIRTLKQETSQTGTTAIVSLYQVPDEIYKVKNTLFHR
jgi:ATP-binding cassette subfamily G (WHITE) protein 2 (PDR)